MINSFFLAFRKFLPYIIVIILGLFLVNILEDKWSEVRQYKFQIEIFPLLLSVLLLSINIFLQAFVWFVITKKMGVTVSFARSIRYWFFSLCGKYVPGKIFLYSGRLYFYEKEGNFRKIIGAAVVLENLFAIIAGLLVMLIAVSYVRLPEEYNFLFSLPFISLFPLLLAFPKFFFHGLNWVLIRLKKEPLERFLNNWDIFQILSIYTMVIIAGGSGFYFLVDSITEQVNLSKIIPFIGIFCTAGIAGMLAVFTPNGLGVREGVLFVLLCEYFPDYMAGIIAVVSRFWVMGVEIFIVAIVCLVNYIVSRKLRYID